jgi:STE24 endopeptidase
MPFFAMTSPESGIVALVILLVLAIFWKLDLIATLLNLKSFPAEIPASIDGIWTTESYAKSRAYSTANAKFSIVESSFSFATLLAFWFFGGFGWWDDLTRQWLPDAPLLAGLVWLGGIGTAQYLLHLPLSYYLTFVLEESFGFNQTSTATFIGDQLKSLMLAILIGGPLISALLWIFSHVDHAWLWAWLFFSAFQLLMMWLAPAVILPLFHQFTPMPDGELRQAIEAMAKRCDFPVAGLFIMDGSKRSSKANAFFTGLGKNKKIALFDTLIDKHTTEELVAILAHEIGHFRCRHIPQRLIAAILQSAVLFYLVGLCTNPQGVFSRLLFDAFDVRVISPHAGLLLFGILFSPVSRLLGILSNAWSRRHEFEADAYAAQHCGSSEPLVTALKKLSTDNLAHPSPHWLRVILDYSHPPLIERLAALHDVGKFDKHPSFP